MAVKKRAARRKPKPEPEAGEIRLEAIPEKNPRMVKGVKESWAKRKNAAAAQKQAGIDMIKLGLRILEALL